MNNILYVIAVALLIFWLLGFMLFSIGIIIHILPVIAAIFILLRIMQGDKAIK